MVMKCRPSSSTCSSVVVVRLRIWLRRRLAREAGDARVGDDLRRRRRRQERRDLDVLAAHGEAPEVRGAHGALVPGVGELDGDGRARRAPEPVPRVVERGLGSLLRDDGRAADGEQRVLGPQPRLPRVVLVGVDDGDALRLRRRRRGPGDDEADAAVAALDALDEVARLARALKLRVRVERRQHAVDGGLEERLGRHRVDVAAVERVEDDRELRRGLARLAALAARRVADGAQRHEHGQRDAGDGAADEAARVRQLQGAAPVVEGAGKFLLRARQPNLRQLRPLEGLRRGDDGEPPQHRCESTRAQVLREFHGGAAVRVRAR